MIQNSDYDSVVEEEAPAKLVECQPQETQNDE